MTQAEAEAIDGVADNATSLQSSIVEKSMEVIGQGMKEN